MTKKRKRVLLISIAIMVFACLSAVVICLLFPFALSTPTNFRVVDEVLYWDEVKGAEEYTMNLDGEFLAVSTNYYPLGFLPEYKTYSIQVSAEGKNRRYSDWSEPYTYEVVEPEGFYESLVLYKENDLVTLKTVGSPKGKIIIPSILNGFIIQRIGYEAFQNCVGITSVVVPNTIKEIGVRAFDGCTSLQTVYLSSGNEVHGSAFQHCSSLEFAHIGDCVDIPSACFSGCEKLWRLSGNNPIQIIGDGAFFGCNSISAFHFDADLYEIGLRAFGNCENLTSLTVDEGNPFFRSEGNCIINREDNSVVVGCGGSVIPKGITAISGAAFWGASIEQVVIPEGVKIVDDRAFNGCLNLTDVQLPDSLEIIGDNSFRSCERLTHITLNEGLKKIERQAFSLTPLKKLEIPSSVTELGSGIATSVSEILAVNEGNANYYSKGNCIFSKADGKLVAGCAASTIPTGTKVIGERAFFECPITEITLPEGLEVIEPHAFSRSNLQRVELPSSLMVIGEGAFSYCNGLTCFPIPDSVRSVESNAFYIVVPKSVTLSGRVAFLGSDVFYSATVYLDYIGEGWNDYNYLGETVYSELRYDGIAPYVYSIECPSGGQITVPYRKGYDFMGWTTEEGSEIVIYPTLLSEGIEINGVSYFYNLTFPLGAPRPEEGTRLYAIWKELDA